MVVSIQPLSLCFLPLLSNVDEQINWRLNLLRSRPPPWDTFHVLQYDETVTSFISRKQNKALNQDVFKNII